MTKWVIRVDRTAEKQFRKLGTVSQKRIKKFIETTLKETPNPRVQGKMLSGPLKQYWRYRVGEYRLLADIQDSIITILIVTIEHRKDVYRT